MDLNIVALAGGVGGAKLADGLAQVLQPEHLSMIVNTGDDFTHLGLYVSPDLDTVCYTLAGMANPATGWGRINETWYVFKELKKMGMPDWFQLGDADIATHIIRSIRLKEGCSLSQITNDLCSMWGIKVKVLPMTDDLVHTWVYTNEGELEFQEYFVHRHCDPEVKGFRFEGAEKSIPAPGVLEAIDHCDAIIICPSNPWVSIDPILAVPDIKTALEQRAVYAVSPIIGNKTVKGPAAKMFSELGIQPSALAVAQHYGSLIRYLVVDNSDLSMVNEINKLGIRSLVTDIFMRDHTDRARLAEEIVDLIYADIKG
ncbi:MAG: 2-phospho-L-lactate transferase [Anaerolineales bacterium]